MWYRYARIQGIWKCTTSRGYYTKFHAVGAAIRDEYAEKPTEDIDLWVKRLGTFVVRKMCENSCQSLSTSVFCDYSSVDFDVRYTSQTLVGEKKKEIERKKEEKVEEEKEIEKVKVKYVPDWVKGQIKYLERELERYKDLPAAQVGIKKEIDRIKKEYGIP